MSREWRKAPLNIDIELLPDNTSGTVRYYSIAHDAYVLVPKDLLFGFMDALSGYVTRKYPQGPTEKDRADAS